MKMEKYKVYISSKIFIEYLLSGGISRYNTSFYGIWDQDRDITINIWILSNIIETSDFMWDMN